MTDTINGRTPEEIKKGLECCKPVWRNGHWATCTDDCPFMNEGVFCRNVLMDCTLALLYRLERERDQIKRVRDAAVRDIEDAAPCFACIRFERNSGDCIGAHVCVDDVLQDALGGKYADYYWEWRGVQEGVKPDEQIRT